MALFVCGYCNDTVVNQHDMHGFTCPSAPPALKSYLQRLCLLDDVPRDSKKTFKKFARKSLSLRKGDSVLEEIWSFLESGHHHYDIDAKKEQSEDAEEAAVIAVASTTPITDDGGDRSSLERKSARLEARQKKANEEKKRKYEEFAVKESSAQNVKNMDNPESGGGIKRIRIPAHQTVTKIPVCKASKDGLLLSKNLDLSETTWCPVCLLEENIYCLVLNHPPSTTLLQAEQPKIQQGTLVAVQKGKQ